MATMNMHLNDTVPVRQSIVAVAITVLALCGCQCTGKDNNSGEVNASVAGQSPHHIFRLTGVDPVSLDPAKGMGAAAQQILLNTYEGLYIARHGGGQPRLAVALEEPIVSEDGLRWSFKINPEYRWSDGVSFEAQHFVDAWRRVVDPATASPMAEDLHILKNGKAVSSGQSPPSALGVRAADIQTLEVLLEHPVPDFTQKLARVPFLPCRLDLIKKHGKAAFLPEHWVSNGPYTLAEWTLRTTIKLEANTTHPVGNQLAFKGVEFVHVEDSLLGEQLFKTGKVDMAAPVPPDSIAGRLKTRDKSLRIDSTLCSTALMFNLRNPVVQSENLRAAIGHAIDRKTLVHHILKRGDKEARGYFPEGLQHLTGYEGATGLEFNPTKAKALLQEATWQESEGNELVLLFNSHDTNQRIAEAIQASVEEHVGIRLTLENVEWKTFLDRVGKGDFAIARSALCGMSDPLDWAEIFLSGGGVNWAGFSDPDYDEQLFRARKSTDLNARLNAAKTAEKVVLERAIVVPLFYQVNAYLLSNHVGGYLAHPENIHLFRDLRHE